MGMKEQIETLKKRLSKYSTHEILLIIKDKMMVVGNNAEEIAKSAEYSNKTKLESPMQEWAYLIGLLMTTEDNSGGKPHLKSREEFDKLEDEVDKINKLYQKMMIGDLNFLKKNSLSDSEKEELRRNLIAYEAFNSYYDVASLRLPEQTIKLINELYIPFDNDFVSITGLSINDFIEFYRYIENQLQKQFDTLDSYNNEMQFLQQKSYQEWISSEASNDDRNGYYKALKNGNCSANEIKDKIITIKKHFMSMGIISVEDIKRKFGDKTTILLDTLTLKRKKDNYLYYDDANPYISKPLCYVDERNIFVVCLEAILNSIYICISNILEEKTLKKIEKIKKYKSSKVEDLFYECFKKLFDDKAIIHRNVCENLKTDEHDFLIEYKDYLIIAEVKATKVRKRLHNSEKSYNRLVQEINKEDGIGYGYHQGCKLRKLLLENESCHIYENMDEGFIIKDCKKKHIMMLVLTLNQFGALSINDHGLIKREDGAPYPWICNWHDFDLIIDLLKYKGKEIEFLLDYIDFRIEKREFLLASDEIDIIDIYFSDKSKLDIDKSLIQIESSMNSLVDQMYFEKKGIPYKHYDNIEVLYPTRKDIAKKIRKHFN